MRPALLSATALASSIAFLVPGGALAQSPLDWSGFYAGLSAGVLGSSSDIELSDYDTITGPDAVTVEGFGGLIGATVGYNQQLGSFVLGVETDASVVGQVLSTTFGSDPTEYDAETTLSSLLTLRARLGYAAGNMLFYGTAGLAGGQASFSTNNVGSNAAASGFTTGVVAGAGVEVAVNDNVSIKTEGLMYQLSPLSDVSDSGKYNAEYQPSGVVVRSGVNFKF